MATTARTIRKLQIRLLPFLFTCYVFAFLDRVNIGFASLTMNRDLAINSQQFGLAIGVFFFGYCALEIPSNVLLHNVGARKWIARILISWGIIAAATALVQNASQLYAARFLLGLAEAGFFPGILLYLTYWFRQREQSRVIALFMTAIPVSTVLGLPVSGLILDHVGWLHLAGWRWLFILEGSPAVVLGLLTYILLPSTILEADFLTHDERSWLSATLSEEAAQKHQRFNLDAVRALGHARVWLLSFIGFTQAIAFYSLVFWTPQVVRALSTGYSNTQVGVLTMIPHLVGLAAIVLIARSSDATTERRYHIAIPMVAGGIGFIFLSSVRADLAVIALLALAAFGVYGFFGPFFASASAFLTGLSAASGIALITSVSNLGGFAGPYIVGVVTRETGSLYGGLVFAGTSMLLSAALCLLLPRENNRY